MAIVQTLIGNVKGPQGETGATGATGAKGDAATITVGSVSTTAYGNAAKVENVGTENDAILNFTIPQGKPGEKTTTMSGLTLDTVTTSADEFPVPAVGENGATVWGKVIKWFADGLAAIRSKLDANKVVNSQTVTEAGYALDAQQANPNVSGSLAAQISELNDSLTYKDGGSVFALNTDLPIPSGATVLMVRVLILSDNIGWTFPLLRSWLTSEIRTYSVGGTGSTSNAYWGADIQATSSAIRLTRVTKNGTAATNFQLALWYR